MTAITIALLFSQASATFNLPEGLLEAVCTVESSLHQDAVHHDDGNSDSLGICQIKYTTAQWLGYDGTSQGLMRPSVNIFYSAKYLAYQLRRHDNDVARALVAYNRGNAIGLQRTEYSDKVIETWESAL